MVSPAVLVAAMKVDSCYISHLVPRFQLNLSASQIMLDIVNQYGYSTGQCK